MTKLISCIFLCWNLLFPTCSSSSDNLIENEGQKGNPIELADPYVMYHDGTYYAYGTKGNKGIEYYISKDLKNWSYGGVALDKNDSWADRWFWAPEVYNVNGRFYMFYSADEHICVATSMSPAGPFVQEEKKPLLENEKAIDSSLFIDDDGTPYISFVRFTDGNAIWIAEMEKDLMRIKKETMRCCLTATKKWEMVWPKVVECSFIIKHEGEYFMTYSANNYQSQDYGVGFATSKTPLGNWTKYSNNPILHNPGTLKGVGHSCMFLDKDNNWRIVFHSHRSDEEVHPRIMHISRVFFDKTSSGYVIRIGKDYITPMIR